MILFTCVKENLWIAQLLKNMRFAKYLETKLNQVIIVENAKHEDNSSMQLFDDNQTINLLVKNAHIHERSKHIDVTYHHVRNSYNKNLIKLNYLSIANMIANDLTKSLVRNKYKNFVRLLKLKKSKVNESWLTRTK